jgi:hypothetical protein
MGWVRPQYARSRVDAAGRVLVDAPDLEQVIGALEVINNWRSSHSFPLNTFQVGLRQRARQVDRNCLIAQRIKRLSSIELKLKRFDTMKLSQVQDIGGCRAIVKDIHKVSDLVEMYRRSRIKHKLDHMDDYIKTPRKSGYRGIHLIYRYYSDRNETYNNLKIEMQLRSALQHAWATAVETVGTFTKQALKSSLGEEDWLRFFALMGTAIAFREKCQPVPGTPVEPEELHGELRAYADRLEVVSRLRFYQTTLSHISKAGSQTDATYFLLVIDPNAGIAHVTGYKANELARGTDDYLRMERSIADRPGAEAVLVGVESVELLRRAFPNYFLDTRVFINAVEEALS